MNKEILERLEKTLNNINKSKEKTTDSLNRSIDREVEKIYCGIWKVILKNITKKESFDLDLIVNGLELSVKVDDIEKDFFLIKKLNNLDVIKEKLSQDGLDLIFANTNNKYKFYVTRQDLENIKESKTKTK